MAQQQIRPTLTLESMTPPELATASEQFRATPQPA